MATIIDHSEISVANRGAGRLLDRAWLGRQLPLLGFREPDAEAVLAGVDQLSAEDWAEVARLRDLLLARVGHLADRANVVGPGVHPHRVAPGFLPLLALVGVSGAVHDELTRRGLCDDVARRSVADLGQQVHIHRRVHGAFGFSATDWVPRNFNGSLVWLGRLQFTIEHDPLFGWVFGCHMPEDGPLDAASVDESLRRARHELVPAFGEYPVERVTCHSWLLDPALISRLPPTSNIAGFARRFTPYGTPQPGRRDALFFGFHVETGQGQSVDLDQLPQDTSLQRAAVDLLRRDALHVQPGWMPLPD